MRFPLLLVVLLAVAGCTETAAPRPDGGTNGTSIVLADRDEHELRVARGQGFGLTSSGGGGTGVTVDTANFCCPEYLSQMVTLIQRNWDSRQQAAGSVIMKFTVTRAGTIENVQVEQSSGFVAHELTAQRALLLTRLPELPIQYPNPTLTIHMRFEYQR